MKVRTIWIMSLLAMIPLTALFSAPILVPVSADVGPTVMVIQIIDVAGRETARLTVPTNSRVVTYIQGGQPTPAPFPPPTPTPGKRTITILEQSEDRTPQQAAILTSQTLRKYLDSKGHKLRITDVDSVPAADKSDLPRLVIEDGDGKVIYQGALPGTVDAVLETIKAHGG